MRFEEPVHTIYKTTNLVNGKFYIGYHKTCDLEDIYLGSGTILNHSIAKYGRENFKKETLFIFKTLKEAFEKEYEEIEKYRKKDPLCMNIVPGGSGYEPTEQSRIRLGNSIRGRKFTEEQKAKLRGRKISEKVLARRLGKKLSAETKEKISSAFRGKQKSEQHIAKLKGLTRTEKTKAKMRKPKSEEHKANMSKSFKGKKCKEETKAKIKAAWISRRLKTG